MRKSKFVFAGLFTLCLIFGFIETKAEQESLPGNEATCYSTYTDPFLFGGTNIWVCGSCVQKKAKEYSDQGVCMGFPSPN